MKNKFIVLTIIGLLISGSLTYSNETETIPNFYYYLPGGPYFYQGDLNLGLAFCITELSFLAAGLVIEEKLQRDESYEWNIPLLVSSQIYVIEKWSYLQKDFIKFEQESIDDYYMMEFDTTPLTQLLLAPFDPEIVFSPFVLTFIFMGGIDGLIRLQKHGNSYSDISSVTAIGQEMDRETGTYYYETSALFASYGAAVSEEMIFRGLLLPLLDFKYGQDRGLIYSSLIFGVMHVFNPDVENALFYASYATLAGLLLGSHVQQNDYRLSHAIAAHFWYNFSLMTFSWLTDPENNPIGVGVTLKF